MSVLGLPGLGGFSVVYCLSLGWTVTDTRHSGFSDADPQ